MICVGQKLHYFKTRKRINSGDILWTWALFLSFVLFDYIYTLLKTITNDYCGTVNRNPYEYNSKLRLSLQKRYILHSVDFVELRQVKVSMCNPKQDIAAKQSWMWIPWNSNLSRTIDFSAWQESLLYYLFELKTD